VHISRSITLYADYERITKLANLGHLFDSDTPSLFHGLHTGIYYVRYASRLSLIDPHVEDPVDFFELPSGGFTVTRIAFHWIVSMDLSAPRPIQHSLTFDMLLDGLPVQ